MRKARTIALAAVVAATASLSGGAAQAHAAFGDGYGIAPVNQPGAQTAPAFPGTHAFWAGACDLASAPFGPIPGGVGTRPDSVYQQPPSSGGFTKTNTPTPAPPTPDDCIDWGGLVPAATGDLTLWHDPPSWRLAPLAQAGAHPDGSATFWFARDPVGIGGGIGQVDGSTDNIYVDLPAGFAGDPNAVPKCTAEQFAIKAVECPPETQVGVLHLYLVAPVAGGTYPLSAEERLPVYNLEPRHGNVAEFGVLHLSGEDAITARIVARPRTNGDFGVTTYVSQIPAALPVISQSITLWGVPWAKAHDLWRPPRAWRNPSLTLGADEIPTNGLPEGERVSYHPSWGPIKPFLSNPTECTGAELSTRLLTDSYENPGAFSPEGDPVPANPIDNELPGWKVYDSPAPPVSGCERLGFDPSITLDPTLQGAAANQATDSASGLDVELSIPQNDDLPFNAPPDGAPQEEVDQYLADAVSYWRSDQGLATSHLEDTVVTLPEGMTLNPAAADGQGACTPQQIGLTDADSPTPPAIRFNNQPVACPDSAKVGEVVVETPLLDEADWPRGSVYLATPGDNPFGSDFAIYIAVESPARGLIVKLAGKVEPDPVTGRLTTTFLENPPLPFDRFRLRFKAGPRAALATPVTCGTHTSVNSFAPYSAPGDPVVVNDPFELSSSPAGGCPASPAERPLNVGFSAGSTELIAGAHSPFTVRLTRPDGNQELDRVEVTTPEGLAAKLAGVPYCPEGALAQAASRTATGDGALERQSPSCPAASQVGTTTVGVGAGRSPFYVGGKVYLAGPYDGAPVSLAFVVPAVAGPFDLGVQVVRTALRVNPRTAQVTAVSDTIPKILRGIPLRIRDVRVDIDRPGFTLNPTDCSEQLVTGRVFGANGAVSAVSNRFQVAECARLPFKPRLGLRLQGGTKRSQYPALTATLTTRPGDANIARTAVALPHSEFLAQEHIRTVCTRVQFAADTCPKAAIYGQATAWSPLLDEPLSGPVYLRSSSDNPLPDLVPDLRGPAHQPVRVELVGRTDSIDGGIRNTFDLVPDAPVTKFVLRMQGGSKGLLVNSRDICARPSRAKVEMTAQNGRTLVLKPKLRASCKGKGETKGERRGQARRAAR